MIALMVIVTMQRCLARFFFFQAEDGIRDLTVTGVQTCALPIYDIQARESQHVLQTYKRQPIAFVRGSGPRLYDVDGREYLDFVSGIGVASLGHRSEERRVGKECRSWWLPIAWRNKLLTVC